MDSPNGEQQDIDKPLYAPSDIFGIVNFIIHHAMMAGMSATYTMDQDRHPVIGFTCCGSTLFFRLIPSQKKEGYAEGSFVCSGDGPREFIPIKEKVYLKETISDDGVGVELADSSTGVPVDIDITVNLPMDNPVMLHRTVDMLRNWVLRLLGERDEHNLV